MNKLLTKIVGLSIGLAMAIGVGVAVGSGRDATPVKAETTSDVLNLAFTGVSGTSYTSWSNKTGTSGTVYAGQSAGDKSSIQLRSNNSNSGIITTTSVGKIKKVTIVWNTTDTASGRTVDIYGKNSAYTSPTNLYDSSARGTKLGSIVCGTSTELTVSGDYEYVGARSNSGALYMTSITFVWEPSGSSKTETTTEISATPATISVNGTSTLSASVTYTGGTISSPNVTYTTEDTSIVSISGSTVTGLAEGTATITGTYAGDDTYAASSGTTTITVTGAVYEGTFSLYSGAISEGDYVIYYSGKAMKNVVASSRLSYSEVTPSNNRIVNPLSSIVWHIAPSGNYWTIYSAAVEKYAAATGSNNQAQLLASGTDDRSLWTVSGSSTYEFVNKARAAASGNSNLRNNGTYGFACYASGTGGALSLYKAPVSVTGVSVSPTSKSLVVGEHQQITATVSPGNATDKSVTWKSYSDSACTTESSAVASVSSTGYVTAVAEGTAYIQVKTTDGGFTAKCTITVTAATVPVTGVSVSPTVATITIGGTQQLTPTVSPTDATNKSVTYSTNNSTVATVSSSGLITANAVGSATITVTTVDGGFTATCAVTVNPVHVTGVTVSPTEVSLETGGNQQLTATVSPDNATDKSVTWKSYSDSACTTESTAVASVSNSGLVTAVSTGTAYIQVKTTDGGFTAICTVNVLNVTAVSFVAGTDTGETSVTKDGVTITTSTMSRSDNYRAYKDADLSVTSSLGNIIKIEFTGVSGNPASNMSIKEGSTGSYETSNNNGTWTGNASTVTFVANVAQARFTRIDVTYEEAETYTITYNANGGTDEMEPTIGTAPIVASNGFTAPEGKVFLKWNTAADGTGDDYRPGDVAEEDLALYAIWSLPVGGDIILNPTAKIVTTTSVTKDAAKCGTAKAGGSTELTVKKAGITKIKMYVAAWSADTPTVSVSVSSGTISPTSITPTADNGISGSSTTYNLEGEESTYRFDFTLTNVPADATITLSTSAGEKRFVVWGATNLFAVNFAETFLSELTCDNSGVDQPEFADDYSWSDFEAIYDNLDEEEQGVLHDATPVQHASPSTDQQKIEASMARYDYIVGKYYYGQHLSTYSDFIDRKPSPIGSYRNILGIINKGSATAVIIVVITSTLSAAAIGGYFLFRRRKEQ